MRINAAVTQAQGEPLRLEAVELDSPGRGEMRVKIVAAGVCHTDAVARDSAAEQRPARR